MGLNFCFNFTFTREPISRDGSDNLRKPLAIYCSSHALSDPGVWCGFVPINPKENHQQEPGDLRRSRMIDFIGRVGRGAICAKGSFFFFFLKEPCERLQVEVRS